MSQRLRECAGKLSNAILSAMNERRLIRPSDPEYAEASEMAGDLAHIRTYLDSPLATRSSLEIEISSEVETACDKVIQALSAITLPESGTNWQWWSAKSTLLDLVERPQYPFFSTKSDLEDGITSLLRLPSKDTRYFKAAYSDLLVKLGKDDADADGMPVSAPYIRVPELSDGFKDSIFAALHFLAQCPAPGSHNTGENVDESIKALASEADSQSSGHPTRLCLQEPEINEDLGLQNINILVSSRHNTPWREFRLMAFSQPREPLEMNEEFDRRGFCSHLQAQLHASIFLSFKDGRLLLDRNPGELKRLLQVGPGVALKDVLCRYDLTPRDKIQLSYAVVRSYWEYYDSDLMRAEWTSDTILFTPDEENKSARLPLSAYLLFPFDIAREPRPEILSSNFLIHRCPRIFDIGVLLLEIGLAEPFPFRYQYNVQVGCEQAVGELNKIYNNAKSQIKKLWEAEWKDYPNRKVYYDRAVGFCLKSNRFVHENSSVQPDLEQRRRVLATTPGTTPYCRADIIEQKATFFKNVVKPLAWMAKTDESPAGNAMPVIAERKQVFDVTLPMEPQASLHTGVPINPELWLQQLGRINDDVEILRRHVGVRDRVRIAILDTGLDRDFPAFKENKRLLSQIVAAKDFVNSTAKPITDTCGHGTLMARLIMECAPKAGVKILVARVAESKEDLENSTESVKKAIMWAGWDIGDNDSDRADIISMSFGFASEKKAIRSAIEEVNRKRRNGIIFLASAGNSNTSEVSFPARVHSVTPVFATNRYGTFLPMNAKIGNKDRFGTFGDDIPGEVCQEYDDTRFKGVCKAGSSVATAVMAGIGATMIAYAHALSSSEETWVQPDSKEVFGYLRTAEGMEELLRLLALQNDDCPRKMSVNPMGFWKDHRNHHARYSAIYIALSRICWRNEERSVVPREEVNSASPH